MYWQSFETIKYFQLSNILIYVIYLKLKSGGSIFTTIVWKKSGLILAREKKKIIIIWNWIGRLAGTNLIKITSLRRKKPYY